MGQQNLPAAVAGQAELLHDLGLLRLRNGRAVEVGALAVGVTLELLETALIMEPLIGEALSAVHTAHWDDHCTTWCAANFGGCQICSGRAPRLSAPGNSPEASRTMSSTLFGRGVNAQVGMRQRAEAVQRSLDELRSTAADVAMLRAEMHAVVRENNTNKTLVGALERRIATLETELAATKSQSASAIDIATQAKATATQAAAVATAASSAPTTVAPTTTE